MVRVDLHVHSRHSEHPSDWFLQRLGAKGSYTQPEEIYRAAKREGMDFVTITDRNRIEGSLALVAAHPEDTFSGCEVTTYFPEDRSKVQILIYGLDADAFDEIQRIRSDIYDLQAYLVSRELVHAVAQPIAPTENRLDLGHIEKLILLFSHFEVQNGGRNRACNEAMRTVIANLTPQRIEEMRRKHRIDPIDPVPWQKGWVGGSDDHAGLFIGRTHTSAEAETPADFLTALAQKRTTPGGRHNDYHSLAFSAYKIAYDFSQAKSGPVSRSILTDIAEMAFDRSALSLADKVRIRTIRARNGVDQETWKQLLRETLFSLKGDGTSPVEDRLSLAHERVASLSDELLRMILRSIQSDLQRGEVTRFLTTLTAALPGVFLSVPFLSALGYLHRNRVLIDSVETRFGCSQSQRRSKRILWFTDTLTDLNGVSRTLQSVARLAHGRGLDVRIVTAQSAEAGAPELTPNVINLPCIFEFSLPLYEQYRLGIPSILKSLERLASLEPDEIYISTPGPIGLLGLLLARLLSTQAVGVYHTDLSMQSVSIGRDEHLTQAIESYSRWFYGAMDRIAVPTFEYMNLLEGRGYDRSRMILFHRGIDTTRFAPQPNAHAATREKYGLREGITLLFAGRIAPDKNLDFLVDVHAALRARRPDVNLVIAGAGPYERDLRHRCAGNPRIVFAGLLAQVELAALYAGSDLFLFPSTTDTFGMAVLEAQACGVPAIVSDRGGPKEIVVDGVTGLHARADHLTDWVEKVEALIARKECRNGEWEMMVKAARSRVLERHDWDAVLTRLTAPTNERFRTQPSVSTASSWGQEAHA